MVTSPVQRGYRQGRLYSSKDGMTEGRLMPLFCLSSERTSAYLPLTSRRIGTKKMDQSLWLFAILDTFPYLRILFKYRYRSGFGGIQDKFDSIFPPKNDYEQIVFYI